MMKIPHALKKVKGKNISRHLYQKRTKVQKVIIFIERKKGLEEGI